MDPNPRGVRLLGSVEGCFEPGGWQIVAVAAEPVLVEPVHPREGGELDFLDVVPGPQRVGSVDVLGLVEPVGPLGQGDVVGVATVPMLGRAQTERPVLPSTASAPLDNDLMEDRSQALRLVRSVRAPGGWSL